VALVEIADGFNGKETLKLSGILVDGLENSVDPRCAC
jgi:hypothetical protein